MRGLAAAARRAPASGKASSAPASDGKQFALRSPLQFWGLPVPEGELGVSASTATRDELLTYLRQMYQVRCAGGACGGWRRARRLAAVATRVRASACGALSAEAWATPRGETRCG